MLYAKTFQVLAKEDALSYYLLGAFITDGCVLRGRQAELSSKDEDWIKLISDKLGGEPKIYLAKDSNYYRLVIYNREVYDWLVAHDCVPRKSLIATIPDVPSKYFRDFVRGIVDGDGCISRYTHKSKGRKPIAYLQCFIVSASKTFAEKLHEQLSAFGFNKHSISNRINGKNPIFRIKFSGKEAQRFLDWVYYDNNPLSMPRKLALAKNRSGQCLTQSHPAEYLL